MRGSRLLGGPRGTSGARRVHVRYGGGHRFLNFGCVCMHGVGRYVGHRAIWFSCYRQIDVNSTGIMGERQLILKMAKGKTMN